MRISREIVLLAALPLAVAFACAQDQPSLGDLARQQREQKEQSKNDKNAKPGPAKVITNEEIPERKLEAAAQARARKSEDADESRYSESGSKMPAEYWRSHIATQKNQVTNLQREIDDLNESIRFAPANCVANCVGWNERQREKQERVERMRGQLQEQKERLDEMQESARKQGYGP